MCYLINTIMSQFLKLTNYIINIKYINSIIIKPDKYYIHVISNNFDGANWTILGFGFGKISSHNYEIEVCKTKNVCDYKLVSDWINSKQ